VSVGTVVGEGVAVGGRWRCGGREKQSTGSSQAWTTVASFMGDGTQVGWRTAGCSGGLRWRAGVGMGGAGVRASVWARVGIVCVCGPDARYALDKVPYLRQLKRAIVAKVLSTWAEHWPS
jgi:hypothetical protein